MGEEREEPGEREEADSGPVVTALSTSVLGNSPAFGFSITITMSFGVMQALAGTPVLTEILTFGVSAAAAVALLEGAITRGFMRRLGQAPPEVAMLGTAMNALSVAAGVGVAIAIGELWTGFGAWPVAGFAVALVYVLAESAETLVAEGVQRLRGDPDADEEES